MLLDSSVLHMFEERRKNFLLAAAALKDSALVRFCSHCPKTEGMEQLRVDCSCRDLYLDSGELLYKPILAQGVVARLCVSLVTISAAIESSYSESGWILQDVFSKLEVDRQSSRGCY